MARLYVSSKPLSGGVLPFASLRVGIGVGVLGVRGEPTVVANLSLPEGLLSGATPANQVGGVRSDLECRGSLSDQAAYGPQLGWWRHASCSTRPQGRLCAVLSARSIVYQRSSVALASVRHRRPHKPHPRIRHP